VSGDTHALVLRLLERLLNVKQLWNDLQYKCDFTYVQMWFRYAAYAQDPSDIYKFMNHNEIGITFPHFYALWASWLIRINQVGQAKKVYELGRSRVNHRQIEAVCQQIAEQHRLDNENNDPSKTAGRRVALAPRGSAKVVLGGPKSSENANPQLKNTFSVFEDAPTGPAGPTTVPSVLGAWESLAPKARDKKKILLLLESGQPQHLYLIQLLSLLWLATQR